MKIAATPSTALHAPIAGTAAAFAGCPARADDVRRLAVDAVRRVHDELVTIAFVDAGRTDVRVELGDLRRNIRTDDEMRGNRVARRVARLEDRIELREGEHTVRLDRLDRGSTSRNRGVGLDGNAPARKRALRQRHERRLDAPEEKPAPMEGKPHVAPLVQVTGDVAAIDEPIVPLQPGG